jgi:formylmethanofuran dehydrogenase subunit A
MKRELSLYEIAILTRAAPARLLGLADRGHLGVGAAADIAIYRDQADREAMFSTPLAVLKDGAPIVRDGRITATPAGGVHFVEPDYDRSIERELQDYSDTYLALAFRHATIGKDELCDCCNRGGRLLPTACLAPGAHRAG